ncbi:hypothetical protein N825_32830 [Skermanella stibiiresistens SB22]|uniref:Uncharacterized protein n=1 Tax=Skermanella stibiiresistens SB22 TaxID=1385369 RepID=W9H3U6_9PROT|nr:hypothetical protein [Skermanella stibiiresistens]EWY40714.1 hypothetical protein N825_32830 [Skermanella stibiiresistens SB22]
MLCPRCCSAKTTERSDRTAHGYRHFRCRGCGRGFNERTRSVLNRLQPPTDMVLLILLPRGMVFSHEAIRDWEASLAPLLTDALRQRRKGKAGRSWYASYPRTLDEVRDFLRPATRRKEHASAARRRAIHVQRVAALRDVLAVA